MSPLEHPCIEQFCALGHLLTEAGFALEQDREATASLEQDVLARILAMLDVPQIYNPYRPEDHGINYPQHGYSVLLSIIERLSRYDASSLMAMPGPSLAGAAVSALGTSEQVRLFFEPYLSAPQHTFLAITEPGGGSDTANGSTILRRDGCGWRLSGHKVLVGGAKRANVGIIFAKIEGSDRRVLVMVHPQQFPNEIRVERLKTLGLAGADLTRIEIDDLPVSEDMLLGGNSRSLRDGFLAISAVFARHRPLVAAMALGTARGLLDLLQEAGADAIKLMPLRMRHEALLRRMTRIGAAYQAGQALAHHTSLFKMDAVELVDSVIEQTFELLGPSALLAGSAILKKCRDGRAFEYMEGTSNIHILQAYRAYVARH
jgi:diaminopimelate decarboxylase